MASSSCYVTRKVFHRKNKIKINCEVSIGSIPSLIWRSRDIVTEELIFFESLLDANQNQSSALKFSCRNWLSHSPWISLSWIFRHQPEDGRNKPQYRYSFIHHLQYFSVRLRYCRSSCTFSLAIFKYF